MESNIHQREIKNESSRSGALPASTHTADVYTSHSRPVVRSRIIPSVQQDVVYEIRRDVHHHDLQTVIQPVLDREWLPEKHWVRTSRGLVPIRSDTTVKELYQLAIEAAEGDIERLAVKSHKERGSLLDEIRKIESQHAHERRDPNFPSACHEKHSSCSDRAREHLAIGLPPSNHPAGYYQSDQSPRSEFSNVHRASHGVGIAHPTQREEAFGRQGHGNIPHNHSPLPTFEGMSGINYQDDSDAARQSWPEPPQHASPRNKLRKVHPPAHKIGASRSDAAVLDIQGPPIARPT